jgi:hypothetical protein
MKTLKIICSLMLLMSSCHSSSDETITLLNKPIEKVTISVSNETFTVDFKINASCKQDYMDQDILTSVFAKLKTRNDLLSFYRTLKPNFSPGYSSLRPDNGEYQFVMSEYMLAQECFSDDCNTNFRCDVLQLAINYQKQKYNEERGICPFCARKTGVFLMAVILVKEWNSSSQFIDAITLQHALLCLSDEETFVCEDFSNLIIDCSEVFLTKNNNK